MKEPIKGSFFVEKYMKDKKELFCSFSYCMKHKCHGCKNERKCDEWDSRNKRDSNNRNANRNRDCNKKR